MWFTVHGLQTFVFKDPNEYQALSKNEEIIWLAHILLLFFQIYVNMLWLQKPRKENNLSVTQFSVPFFQKTFLQLHWENLTAIMWEPTNCFDAKN